jgi:small subunit ribosomal protein S2
VTLNTKWSEGRRNRGGAEKPAAGPVPPLLKELRMADTTLVKKMIEAGIHFGHRSAGWNPKMAPYIYGKRNGIHIIDVRHTIKGLLLARKFITRTVAGGKDVLFVGTKRQARPTLESQCGEEGMPYVIERWLGGTLTNFRTIRSRLKRLEELESLMSGEDWSSYSKKMASQLTRERRKIDRNLGGIRTMDRLPGAVVVIDVRREINALREAQKLGIPTVCLIDTDSDPDLADIPIPGNDDAMRAIELVVGQLIDAVKEGKTARAQAKEGRDQVAPGAPRPRRRSSRSQFRAEEDEESAAGSEPAAEEPQAVAPSEAAAPQTEAPAPPQPTVETPEQSPATERGQ